MHPCPCVYEYAGVVAETLNVTSITSAFVRKSTSAVSLETPNVVFVNDASPVFEQGTPKNGYLCTGYSWHKYGTREAWGSREPPGSALGQIRLSGEPQ